MNFLKKLFAVSFAFVSALAVSAQAQEEAPDVAEMMKLMEKFATPGPQHELIGKLAGKWETSTTMMGMPATPGTAEFAPVLGGRYMQQTYAGTMMGQPYSGIGFMGYDNYKKKFTSTWMDSVSTAKNIAEGMLDQTGHIINFYGTMDEYLTGEHDKPVKYVLNMTNPDRVVFEVHDLAIGENSKVIEIVYERVKQ